MFKHIASNWSRILLQILVMLLLTPILVGKLGNDGYGIWTTVIAATLILEQLALGVPLASVRHISEAITAKDTALANRMIATGYGVTIALGLVGLVLGAVLFVPFERGLVESETWQDTPAKLLDGARLAYIITAVRVAAGLALRFPNAVFDAHRDFVTSNAIQIGGILFRVLAVLGVLYTSPSLEGIAWVFVVEAIGVFLAFRFFIHRRFPGIRFGLADFDRGSVRAILSFGILGAVLNIGTMIAYQFDGLVIARMLGPEFVTDFEMGNKFFLQLAALMYGVGAVVMPEATRLRGEGDERALEHVYLKWSKVSFSVVLPICLYLTVLGPGFLMAWLGDSYRDSMGVVTRILAPSFAVALPVRAVALPILLGTSEPGRPAAVYLVLAFGNLALSILLVSLGYGLVGVALGTAIPQIIFAAYLLIVTSLQLSTSVLGWLRYVALRALLGAVPCAALLLWFEHGLEVEGFGQLVGAGVAMLAMFAVVWTLFVYRGDPFIDVRAELAEKFGRRGA